ncbi:HNH endonuclease [Sarcina ventriculi]|uniref:HNH endonuclease n=1 Tax=Sarcina ventriculi TaxID=1267 RepID=UPI0018A92967|nr:HNH endonuclease [Sarcina ventriculi]
MILTIILIGVLIFVILGVIGIILDKHDKKKEQNNIKPTPKKQNHTKYLGPATHDNPEAWIEKRAKQYTNIPPRQRNKRYNGHHHTAEYENYIHSNAWRKRRQQALYAGHNRCAMCGATTSLQVHHLTYKHLGHELDSELMVLCTSCHHKVHAQKRRKNYYMN